MGSSKKRLMLTSSLIPLRRLVLTMNSRASSSMGAGSSGRSWMLLSSGSPGTMLQWSKQATQKAWPCVWYRRSVSKPKLSITGMKACTR